MKSVSDLRLCHRFHIAQEVADLSLGKYIGLLHVWLNYSHLIDVIPLASMVTTNGSHSIEVQWTLTHDLD